MYLKLLTSLYQIVEERTVTDPEQMAPDQSRQKRTLILKEPDIYFIGIQDLKDPVGVNFYKKGQQSGTQSGIHDYKNTFYTSRMSFNSHKGIARKRSSMGLWRHTQPQVQGG